MRIGEALRLTLQDVDLAEQVITVRDTKFFKTRLVPIGPKLTEELAAHLERRANSQCPVAMHRRYSRREMVASGVIRASSPGSKKSAGRPESTAVTAR
jgi:integrase